MSKACLILLQHILDDAGCSDIYVPNGTNFKRFTADTHCGPKLQLPVVFGEHDFHRPFKLFIEIVGMSPLKLQKLTISIQLAMGGLNNVTGGWISGLAVVLERRFLISPTSI